MSREEYRELPRAADNFEHEVANRLMGDCGLRVAEVLDAAIETLRSDQDEDADGDDADYDPDDEFVEVLSSVDGLGPTVAKRLEERFDSLEAVVDASDEELKLRYRAAFFGFNRIILNLYQLKGNLAE